MQKKVIALAIAGLVSGAAFAQTSNVTIYGFVDVEGVNVNTGNSSNGARVKNLRGFDDGNYGSRLGFKGEEDLGNGLKAVFLTEYGINPTTNIAQMQPNAASANQTNSLNATTSTTSSAQSFQSRQTYAGLRSATLGEVSVGRFQSAGWDFAVKSRPWGGIADTHRTLANVTGMSIHPSDRISNAIQYTTPVWGGFLGKALYSSDSAGTQADFATGDQNYNGLLPGRQSIVVVSGDYTWNALNVMGIVRKVNNEQNNQGLNNGKTELGVLASYDFKVVKVGAHYQNQNRAQDVAVVNAQGVTNLFRNSKLYSAYATVPFGQFAISLQAAKTTAENSIGGTAWGLNGSYDFSKRTQVYAQYGHFAMNGNNQAATNLGSYGNVPFESGVSANAYGIGMLHKF